VTATVTTLTAIVKVTATATAKVIGAVVATVVATVTGTVKTLTTIAKVTTTACTLPLASWAEGDSNAQGTNATMSALFVKKTF
jgi:hypothetical protein